MPSDTLDEESYDFFLTLHTKFVSEVDLPECELPFCTIHPYSIVSTGEEKRRFVLFPIQYHKAYLLRMLPKLTWR